MRTVESKADLSPLELAAFSQARVDELYDYPIIRVYIDAAIAQAEQITGRALSRRTIVERVDVDRNGTATLKDYPVGPVRAMVDVGCDASVACLPAAAGRYVQVAVNGRELSTYCALTGLSLRVEYLAGPANEVELMQGYPDIIAGVLALTTWMYENRGDVDAGNALHASGAFSHWHTRRSIVA
jgi:hypothetical protein